jgi:polar amino acid transport system substrate-binding protein
MKRWKIVTLMCVAVVVFSLALTGCNSQTYTPQSKSQVVSASALGKDGTLRVGVNASSAPLAGQTSSSSKIVGIDVDVAAYLADELGLKVEIVDVGNDPSAALKAGTVDVVLGVDASDDDADYWRSASYLETGVALFGNEAETAVPTADSKPKIAAQASSKSSWRVTNLFGDDALVVQSDLKSAFSALANGSARYVAADAVIGTYVSYSNGYPTKIVALLQDPSGYCAAVASTNTELQSAMSSAMTKLINGGMMGVIENKWLGQTIDLDSMTVVKSSSDNSKSSSKKEEAKTEETEDEGAAEGAEGEGEEAVEGQ